MMRTWRGGALLLCALAAPLPVVAQQTWGAAVALVDAGGLPTPDLDVPFVPQSPALCGGAAVAMVLRYWGERGIFADEFAPLVVPTREGILTGDLLAAVRERGWRAEAFTGTADAARAHLARGWPIIALIEVRPDRYHYVVIVGWTDDVVRVHDPARGPARTQRPDRFKRAWQASGRWAMLVLPPHDIATAPASARPAASEPTAAGIGERCAQMLDSAAVHARGGDAAAADRALDAALGACEPAVVAIERAALRFREGSYGDAAALSREALLLRPDDSHGWNLLASSRYLMDDAEGALAAWNKIGRPRNDLSRISGARQTRFAVFHDALGIAPGAVVTPAALRRAARRLDALPTVARSRVDYLPVPGGDVEVRAAVVERPVVPLSAAGVVTHALRAATTHRVELGVAGPAGVGELWQLSYGWRAARRDTELLLAAPHAFGTTALWTLLARDQVRSFDIGSQTVQERAQIGAASVSDWASGWLRWGAHAVVEDHFRGSTWIGAGGELELRAVDDRSVLRVTATAWSAAQQQPMHMQLRLRSRLTSDPNARWQRLVRLGADATSVQAPRSHWAGAGAEDEADVLLRGRSLLNAGGVVRGALFAPTLLHGGFELRYWAADAGPLGLGVAAFIDGATIPHRSHATRERHALDAGVGARLRAPGVPGIVRLDLARSLGGDRAVLSMGWLRAESRRR
jgi:hypothetical protein